MRDTRRPAFRPRAMPSSERYDTIFRPGLFERRVAIVTGGGSGIGRCTAHELAALGARVALIGRKLEKLQAVSNEISQTGEAKCYACDIREEDRVRDTVAAIYAGLGDQDQAFKWLDKAVEERDIWLMNLKVDPVFAKLRSQRKFTDTLARIRLRP